MMKKKPTYRNFVAKSLADRQFHQRTVKSRKGKGSYDRKRMEKRCENF